MADQLFRGFALIVNNNNFFGQVSVMLGTINRLAVEAPLGSEIVAKR